MPSCVFLQWALPTPGVWISACLQSGGGAAVSIGAEEKQLTLSILGSCSSWPEAKEGLGMHRAFFFLICLQAVGSLLHSIIMITQLFHPSHYFRIFPIPFWLLRVLSTKYWLCSSGTLQGLCLYFCDLISLKGVHLEYHFAKFIFLFLLLWEKAYGYCHSHYHWRASFFWEGIVTQVAIVVQILCHMAGEHFFLRLTLGLGLQDQHPFRTLTLSKLIWWRTVFKI